MIDTLYQGHIYLGEEHYAWVKDGQVCLAKDDNNAYIQRFESREELMAFVAHLIANANLAWPVRQDTHTCCQGGINYESVEDDATTSPAEVKR